MGGNYCLYLDESGNHGLTEINPQSPIFLLCGILISGANYIEFREDLNKIKRHFWGDKSVIFHSRDIRKCQKEFQILLDYEVKVEFYRQLNACIAKAKYTIITSVINKDNYIKRYGTLSNDVYELCLSFIIERSIFYLDDIYRKNKSVDIIIEKRGKKEDRILGEHFQKLMSRGTGYVSAERLSKYGMNITFKSKKDNINGLQLADLLAYPISTFAIDKNRANPAFDIFKDKFYFKNGKRYGFKMFP